MSGRVVEALRALREELSGYAWECNGTGTTRVIKLRTFQAITDEHIAAAEQRAARPALDDEDEPLDPPCASCGAKTLHACRCVFLPPEWLSHPDQRAAEDPTQRALRDAALAQLATWCESSAPETEGVICTARAGVYLMCAAEARRLAADPLPKVVHVTGDEPICGECGRCGVADALLFGEPEQVHALLLIADPSLLPGGRNH